MTSISLSHLTVHGIGSISSTGGLAWFYSSRPRYTWHCCQSMGEHSMYRPFEPHCWPGVSGWMASWVNPTPHCHAWFRASVKYGALRCQQLRHKNAEENAWKWREDSTVECTCCGYCANSRFARLVRVRSNVLAELPHSERSAFSRPPS